MKTTTGKWNISLGIWELATFMVYGFVLIYLRDLSPNREAWIASSLDGPHALARLAHVHGTLFPVLNIIFGYLLLKLPIAPHQARWISGLALVGLLMPIGVLTKLYLGMHPFLVLLGSFSIIAATIWLGLAVLQIHWTETGLSEK